MSWIEDQNDAERIENYQNYRITRELQGNMTPSAEGVIRLMKGRYRYEKVQDKKEQLSVVCAALGGAFDDDTCDGTR